ncbi:RluA family pseudouridine synthase [Anaerococcus degeneri]|uniref:Pseudouridine synthase n=1 Tax=Anaerococcus degeneri TaxID=361500 RepID=A0ABS7Z1C7_9FIRM|nr:RluA family pseudouridine synthase [Anaerococcus degeneri]MBP2014981.1 23S rRNA pseudouridine955/2504/2580 synthase [Anaerococcus degeneri]MCA2097189.1 RluA family pseudouridine synthase [Anaerococcus degeneri]
MIEIIISKNQANQRFDRFLRKYFENAPLSVILKNIRKKNFKINNKRAKNNDFVYEGDVVKMYISDENYNEWLTKTDFKPGDFNLDIVYEDDNIIIMDKDYGELTHAASKDDYGNNLVDNMLSYLYKTKSFDMSDKTFKPAVVNRLDRNTAGLVIGAKNSEALRILNKTIKENKIDKYYLTLVSGEIRNDFKIDSTISKNKNKNKVKKSNEGKNILTYFKALETNGDYSFIECKLITGRTHQIRYSLRENGTPVLGDRKYGFKQVNAKIRDKFGINNQILLSYKIVFPEIKGLEYLAGKEFLSKKYDDMVKLKEKIMK